MRTSTSSGCYWYVCLVVCTALTGFMIGSACAQKTGEIAELQGAAEILRAAETQYKHLGKGDPVQVGDMVSTKEGAKVLFRLGDESYNSLGASSSLMVNEYSSEGRATYFHAHQPLGIVRFIKRLSSTSPASSYTISTPTGVVSVEPTAEAADFVVQVLNSAVTAVTVMFGQVRVRNISEKIPTERVVRSCQMVYVREGKEPSKPFGVSSDTLRKLIDLTTIPRTLPDEVPNCDPIVERYPPPRPCPCPWGFAQDPIDGQCKPCAFAAGAFYNPETCECECGVGPGYFDPITGTYIGDCPTQVPVAVPGLVPPNPNVLPHEGCPRCVCCPDATGCYTSRPGDGSCPHPRCGACAPGQALPAAPGTDYPCPKCCECDLGGAPGNPCGLNAAGFPIVTPCGAGLFPGKCIAMSDCQANGGYFVQTSPIPGWPCWICQKDPPLPYLAAYRTADCGPCKRRTWRRTKAKCIPEPEGMLCLVKGKCGECKAGKCVELPPCPPGQQRNSRCVCVPTEKPEPECASHEQCRKKTNGLKPCCEHGQCVKLRRCPDGTYRCECVIPLPPPPLLPPPPPPPDEHLVECSADSQCVRKFGDARPCCVRGVCTPRQSCPDGSYRCICEPAPAPCTGDSECVRKFGDARPCCVHGTCTARSRCHDGSYRCKCEPEPGPCRSDGECVQKHGDAKPCCVHGVCKASHRCPDGTHRCNCEPEPFKCSSDGQCAQKYGNARPCCVHGVCKERQRCPDGKDKCHCEPGPARCTSDNDCVRSHGSGKPCCVDGVCSAKRQCPDGSQKCRCDVIPHCGQCQELVHGKCQPCSAMGKVCERATGKCVTKPPPEDPCKTCRDRGMDCVDGKCVPKKKPGADDHKPVVPGPKPPSPPGPPKPPGPPSLPSGPGIR